MRTTIRTGVDAALSARAARAAHASATRVGGPPSQADAPVSPARAPLMRRVAVRAYGAAIRLLYPAFEPLARRIRRYMTTEVQRQLALGLNHVTHELKASTAESAKHGEERSAHLVRRLTWEADVARRERDQLADDLQRALSDVSLALQQSVTETRNHLGAALERVEVHQFSWAKRFALAVGQNEILIRCEPGYVLCSANDVQLVAALVESGELELGTRILIERLLRPGDVFVDAGANVGLHTLAAARALEGKGRIIAVEPYPATAALLRRTMAINGFDDVCEVHEVALSDHQGESPLYLGATSGHHSLLAPDRVDEKHVESVTVPMVPLDDLIEDADQLALIKLDVEGAELEVVRGATAALKRSPNVALIAEFGRSHLKRSGTSSQAWLEEFTSRGFDWRAIGSLDGALNERTLEEIESVESVNLFFASPDSPAWDQACHEK